MKKTIILFIMDILIVAFCLTACKRSSQLVESIEETVMNNVEEDYDLRYWEEIKRVVMPPENVIPNEAVAGGVATEIFISLQPDLLKKGYVLQSITYIEKDDVWIITFYPDIDVNSKTITLGGDWNIAIRKNDGAVIRIFTGE